MNQDFYSSLETLRALECFNSNICLHSLILYTASLVSFYWKGNFRSANAILFPCRYCCFLHLPWCLCWLLCLTSTPPTSLSFSSCSYTLFIFLKEISPNRELSYIFVSKYVCFTWPMMSLHFWIYSYFPSGLVRLEQHIYICMYEYRYLKS